MIINDASRVASAAPLSCTLPARKERERQRKIRETQERGWESLEEEEDVTAIGLLFSSEDQMGSSNVWIEYKLCRTINSENSGSVL